MTLDNAIERFLSLLTDRETEHVATNYENLTPSVFSRDPRGRKFVRIVKADANGSSRSVFCFIERTTGNILKADGWKRPAPHARGNIFGENPLAGTTPYGAAYL